MRNSALVLIIIAAAALAACGASESEAPDSPDSPKVDASKSNVSATAEEVAQEARGRIKCPAKIKSATRDATLPIDDVVGVSPGMTYEEAENVVLCTHDLLVVQADTSRRFNIETYGQTIRQGFSARFAEPRVQKTSKQIMEEMQDRAMARGSNRLEQDMKPGQSKWYVGTMGMPGEERVINAAREEWFAEGRNPPIASVVQALIDKYGKPTKRNEAGEPRYSITWAYDSFGRLVTETSPLFNQCSGSASPDGGVNLSPDCGIVVSANIFSLRDNPELARFMQVGVVDQAGGYERVTATEQRLRETENARRAEQVEDAAKNAGAPTL
jgi:hypothetical protein